MTPAELRTIRNTLGLSAERFARLTGTAKGRTVRRWEDDRAGSVSARPISGPVAVLAILLRDHPALLPLVEAAAQKATGNPDVTQPAG